MPFSCSFTLQNEKTYVLWLNFTEICNWVPSWQHVSIFSWTNVDHILWHHMASLVQNFFNCACKFVTHFFRWDGLSNWPWCQISYGSFYAKTINCYSIILIVMIKCYCIQLFSWDVRVLSIPDSKVHGAKIGSTWSAADRTLVGPKLAPRTLLSGIIFENIVDGSSHYHILVQKLGENIRK